MAVTTLLSQGSRITCTEVPLHGVQLTLLLLIQTETKEWVPRMGIDGQGFYPQPKHLRLTRSETSETSASGLQ